MQKAIEKITVMWYNTCAKRKVHKVLSKVCVFLFR